MSNLLLMNVGAGVSSPVASTSSSAAAATQMQFFENFFGVDIFAGNAASHGTFSIQAVQIPLSISWNIPIIVMSKTGNLGGSSGSATLQLGLYSLNGSTLSLANSASQTWRENTNLDASGIKWLSLVTSATQNITPGNWYLGLNYLTITNGGDNVMGNSSVNPAAAFPNFVMGRLTASTNAPPSSIATSDIDITGSDATRQPYIMITA